MTQVATTYRLYRFWDRSGHLLYIGETGRLPFLRMLEHVYAQPWAGKIGSWAEDPAVYLTPGEVLAAEEAAIKAERPRYNVVHNLGNPHRVPVRRARRSRRVPMSQSSRRLRRRWSARARRRAWRAGLWSTAAVVLAGWCWLGAHVAFGDSVLVGVAGTVGLGLAVRRKRKRRRRR